MAQVTLSIAGRDYAVACSDGEEPRLKQLGAIIDAKAREAGAGAPGMTESRVLLYAALLIADDFHEARSGGTPGAEPTGEAAEAVHRLAERVAALAERLEAAGVST